jgi:thioredoxin-related protein
VTKQAFVRYGVSTLPSLVVIDKEGRVVAYLVGVIDEASLDEIVAAAL